MNTLAMLLPAIAVAIAAIVAVFGWRPFTAWLAPLSSVTTIGIGVVLAVHILANGPITAVGGQLRVDALSALMIILIGTVAAITTTYGIAYLRSELATQATTPRRAKIFAVLVQLTIAAMLIAVIADNLGVLWVAVETTTVATVLLVGHRRDRASLEASWKYLVLGSIGVATALMGTVLVYFVSRHSGGDATTALNWSSLVQRAPTLDPGALRLAIGLVVLGYGTKAGLAPLHSWLPDAYSQAPAPVAALMAGVVSSMSIYALLRFKVVADLALGAGFVRSLLVAAALASLVTAASLIDTQRDYKRLVAYSSVEHMGLIALAAAIGSPLAMSAALLHMIGNGLAKSVAFSATGEILFIAGTTRIEGVRGLLRQHPFVGAVFGLSVASLLGLPPFSLFASEIAIVRAGISDGLTWVIAISLTLMLAIFTAIVIHSLDILTDGDAASSNPEQHITSISGRIPLVVGLVAAAAVGVTIWPIERLLHAAAAVVAR